MSAKLTHLMIDAVVAFLEDPTFPAQISGHRLVIPPFQIDVEEGTLYRYEGRGGNSSVCRISGISWSDRRRLRQAMYARAAREAIAEMKRHSQQGE